MTTSPSPPKRAAETQDDEAEMGAVAASKRIKVDDEGETSSLITTNAEGKKIKKVIRRKERPAPPQVDSSTFKSEPPPQTGTIFNIWYNKWSGGDREDKYLAKHAAPSRCIVKEHTGYTKADSVPGSYFCLFFAKGICPKGRDCEYLHRLPSTFDIYSGNVDCFGREKHSDYRDDMGGVGSFMRQNRTLYIGRIHPTDDIEEVVARHFSEWGKIERVRVLPSKGVAFVTYVTESLAQFAKEAMAHQSLDNSEILNVRWATVDPNPQAQKREARKVDEQAAEAIRKALPESFVREIEGRDPEAKYRRKQDGSFGLAGYEANDKVWYESEKARMELEQQQQALLESSDERLLLEDNGLDSNPVAVTGQNGAVTGILSSSTLNALGNYTSEPAGGAFASKAPSGQLDLGDYDTDDDSNDEDS